MAVAFLGCLPLINSGTRKRGISVTFAVVVVLSPLGMWRTVVLVVSVFMIFWRSGQNHACELAKSFCVSLMSMGSLELGSASLQKAKVWPLLGCWVPNATLSLLMPCRTITWLWGFMMASRGNGAGCSPKRRMHESGVQLPAGENIPSNTCWDSRAPIMGFPFFPRKWQALVNGSSLTDTGKVMLYIMWLWWEWFVVAMLVPADVWVMVVPWVELLVKFGVVPVPRVTTVAAMATVGFAVLGCSVFMFMVVWMSMLAMVVLSRGLGVVGEAVSLV